MFEHKNSTNQCEQDKEASDVSKHPAEGDLERTKDFKSRHEEGGPGDAQHVGNGKQDIRDDLRVVWMPVESHCRSNRRIIVYDKEVSNKGSVYIPNPLEDINYIQTV